MNGVLGDLQESLNRSRWASAAESLALELRLLRESSGRGLDYSIGRLGGSVPLQELIGGIWQSKHCQCCKCEAAAREERSKEWLSECGRMRGE